MASGQVGVKVDSRVELDTPTFALFSRLPRSQGALGEVPRIGEARVQKFGARLFEVIAKQAPQPDTTSGRGGAGFTLRVKSKFLLINLITCCMNLAFSDNRILPI